MCVCFVVVGLLCKQHLIELRAIGDTIWPSHDSANTKKNNEITAFVQVSIQRWNHRPAIKLKQTHRERKKCEQKRIENKKRWHYRVSLIVTTVNRVNTRIFDRNKVNQCRTHGLFILLSFFCYFVLKRDSTITNTDQILWWGQTFQTTKLWAKWIDMAHNL